MEFIFNLQLFNEEAEADTPPAAEGQEETTTTEEAGTFTQDDVDGIVAKRLTRERAKFEKDIEVKIAKQLKEAERLATLSEEDKAEELRAQEIADFETERKEFQKEKLELQITKELAAKNLPITFAHLLVSEDAEQSLENIKSFEADWKEALQKAVVERLKGTTPGAGGAASTSESGLGKRLAEQRKLAEPEIKENPYF